MKILFAVIADEISDSEDGCYDVKGLQHTFLVNEELLPEERKLTLHACFRADIEDQFQEVDLSVRWVNEATGESWTIKAPFDLSETVGNIRPTAMTIMPMHITFNSTGRHRFDLIIDGEKVGEVPFEVVAIHKMI